MGNGITYVMTNSYHSNFKLYMTIKGKSTKIINWESCLKLCQVYMLWQFDHTDITVTVMIDYILL